MKSLKKIKAFTLIELLVVIAIISILITIGAVSYRKTSMLSRDARRKGDLEQIRQALETYRSENNEYPDDIGDLETDYINTLPTDPTDNDYTYTKNSDTKYELCATTEIEPTPYCRTNP